MFNCAHTHKSFNFEFWCNWNTWLLSWRKYWFHCWDIVSILFSLLPLVRPSAAQTCPTIVLLLLSNRYYIKCLKFHWRVMGEQWGALCMSWTTSMLNFRFLTENHALMHFIIYMEPPPYYIMFFSFIWSHICQTWKKLYSYDMFRLVTITLAIIPKNAVFLVL